MTEVPISDWDREAYIVGGSAVSFDEVMTSIERYSTELQVVTLPVARGSIVAYNLAEVLREALLKRAQETGDTVVSDLSPQLIGLEGHIVRLTDLSGDERQVRIEVHQDPKFCPTPRHVEVRLGARRYAQREYEKVEVVK
jgi:hypothetical protein